MTKSTKKVGNTARRHQMEQYKQLYDAMITEAEGGGNDANWVGLGSVDTGNAINGGDGSRGGIDDDGDFWAKLKRGRSSGSHQAIASGGSKGGDTRSTTSSSTGLLLRVPPRPPPSGKNAHGSDERNPYVVSDVDTAKAADGRRGKERSSGGSKHSSASSRHSTDFEVVIEGGVARAGDNYSSSGSKNSDWEGHAKGEQKDAKQRGESTSPSGRGLRRPSLEGDAALSSFADALVISQRGRDKKGSSRSRSGSIGGSSSRGRRRRPSNDGSTAEDSRTNNDLGERENRDRRSLSRESSRASSRSSRGTDQQGHVKEKRGRRRRRSRSRGSSRGSSGRSRGNSSDSSRYGDDSEGYNSENAATANEAQRQKKGIFGKIKQFAGKVKTTLEESLGTSGGVHKLKYKMGERARYRIHRISESLEPYVDMETYTVEVEIVGVHIDAVLADPYYTIQLPDDTRKQTNWLNLTPLSWYKKSASQNEDDRHGAITGDSRHRRRSRSRSSGRRRRERSGSSSSSHRHKRRSLSRGSSHDDGSSRSACSSSRQSTASSHRRASSSRRRSPSPAQLWHGEGSVVRANHRSKSPHLRGSSRSKRQTKSSSRERSTSSGRRSGRTHQRRASKNSEHDHYTSVPTSINDSTASLGKEIEFKRQSCEF